MDVWTQQIAALERRTRRLRAAAAAVLSDHADTAAQDSQCPPPEAADFESFPHPVPVLTRTETR